MNIVLWLRIMMNIATAIAYVIGGLVLGLITARLKREAERNPISF